jgi:hypothetical protein
MGAITLGLGLGLVAAALFLIAGALERVAGSLARIAWAAVLVAEIEKARRLCEIDAELEPPRPSNPTSIDAATTAATSSPATEGRGVPQDGPPASLLPAEALAIDNAEPGSR